MRNNFTRGLVMGSIIGASVGMAMNSDMVNGRSRKKIKKSGAELMRKSGSIIGDVIDLFR
ncbi:YtxH domain-containing protein [Herbivorax sp. ANBcel31]|uniref:YtxH domain-containing protein n=1 Tax=Herbivorax sp. ANBcel31 TaxID=3069754 RepID=UPI0027AFD8E8|nr:YtxH domain-containing protein [Herbivorax sp. ANBcel31]MDQ2085675.1 YtxH domain-containing protein [Herbivorax sp. ANBcel31]